jgi:hypothetical protein
MIELNGREIQEIEIDGVDRTDYPDFVDAYVVYAEYADTGQELTLIELDQLEQDYPGLAQELARDNV